LTEEEQDYVVDTLAGFLHEEKETKRQVIS
jgi:hypothetical protein